MAALKFLVLAAAVAALVGLSAAVDHTTPNGGWQLGGSLSSWATSQTFTQGDNVVFSYDSTQHNVVEVTKANYDSCSTTGAIKTYSSGNDVIPLSTATKRYFICGKIGHCAAGMKVEIDTVASSSPAPATPGTPPTPPTPGTSPAPPTPPTGTSPPPPPPSKSGANGHGLQAKGAAVWFGFGMFALLAL